MTHMNLSMQWVSAVCAFLALLASSAFGQERFDTPEAAFTALVEAAKQDNRDALLQILGPDGKDVIDSGDEVADRNARDTFVSSYDEQHSMEAEGEDKRVLLIGSDEWPLPIPVVKKGEKWELDAAAGLEEILLRRIGENELSAIEASLAYVAAQNEYARLDVDGLRPPAYAQWILSDQGKKDGLYWPSAEGEEQSPLGALFAEASAEGYEFGDGPTPYHGYYYRILTSQGADADGGTYNYVVDGRMIGGFGLIAYPAEYGSSGIMTFIVNHDGRVFQKDLGPDTDIIADQIEAFSPDRTWKKVEMP